MWNILQIAYEWHEMLVESQIKNKNKGTLSGIFCHISIIWINSEKVRPHFNSIRIFWNIWNSNTVFFFKFNFHLSQEKKNLEKSSGDFFSFCVLDVFGFPSSKWIFFLTQSVACSHRQARNNQKVHRIGICLYWKSSSISWTQMCISIDKNCIEKVPKKLCLTSLKKDKEKVWRL